MRRIVSIGPALVVLIACGLVALLAPSIARRTSVAATQGRVELVRQALEDDTLLEQIDREIAMVAESVLPSVVHIDAQTPRRSHPGSSGAGWILTGDGLIVTNAHVVRGASGLTVELADGRTSADVEIVGMDPYTDVAVLRARNIGALIPVDLAVDSTPHQGERAFAFGSPFGFKFSMSEGIISALGREPAGAGAFGGFTNYIQTDAAVNPGNSGGPLVNVRGELIGMNVTIATARNTNGSLDDDNTGDSAGISFAIPLGTIRAIVDQIVEHGDVRRGFLGIRFKEGPVRVTLGDSQVMTGIYVNLVTPGAAAEAAGLRAGDVIVEINGSPVLGEEALRSLVTSARPGEPLDVQVFRDGELHDARILPDEMPPEILAQRALPDILFRLGVLTSGEDGKLTVQRVWDGSPADDAGLRRGDVIAEVAGEPVRSFMDLYIQLDRAGLLEGDVVPLTVDNASGESRQVSIAL